MKKYWYILMMMLCCSLAFTACGDDDDEIVIDEAWKQQNDEAFEAIANNPAYKELKSLGNNGSIYYKVLKEGKGTEQIYYTSTIKAYYTLWFMDDLVNPHESVEYPYQNPSQFSVSGVVQGWTTALQYMHVGDRWEVWVPYELGYGAAGKVDPTTGVILVPGYSTLKYEMEVAEIVTQ